MIDFALRPMDGDDEGTRAKIAQMQPIMIAQNDQLWSFLDDNFLGLTTMLDFLKVQFGDSENERMVIACIGAVVSELAVRRNARFLGGEKQ